MLTTLIVKIPPAYAESLDKSVASGTAILKIGTGLILGFVSLGVMLTVGGWLLDIFNRAKLKIYMEISIYLLAMLVPLIFFMLVISKVKAVGNM